MVATKKIREGKTKIIWATENPYIVLIENKDSITAGDGARKELLKDKAILATATTCNCFQFLNSRNIKTHYLERVGNKNKTFQARLVDMVPVECVARRIAFGSYLKRHPDVEEGTRFEKVKVEFFLKNDAQHDPLMVFDKDTGLFNLYEPKVPHSSGLISPLYVIFHSNIYEKFLKDWTCIEHDTRQVFHVLEEAWAKQNVTLVDLKIEFGFSDAYDSFVVADVIDNDSWRIWPGGDKSQMKDKQIFRDAVVVDERLREELKKNYSWVAEATEKF